MDRTDSPEEFSASAASRMEFLFLIGALLTGVAIQFLPKIKESGEVDKDVVVRIMRSSIRSNVKDNFLAGSLINWHSRIRNLVSRQRRFRRLKSRLNRHSG
jgi:hypothetical protein